MRAIRSLKKKICSFALKKRVIQTKYQRANSQSCREWVGIGETWRQQGHLIESSLDVKGRKIFQLMHWTAHGVHTATTAHYCTVY